MENYANDISALSKVRQPKPEITSSSDTSKIINNPYVGIIETPKPTLTPIADTLTLKRSENPYKTYKLDVDKKNNNVIKNNSGFLNLDNLVSIGIITTGFIALKSLFTKK